MTRYYWMYRVVPENMDRERVSKVVERFYGKWIHIASETYKYSYNIVLSKNCRTRLIEPNTVITCIDNENTESIRKAIEYGKAFIRQYVSWNGSTYLLSSGGEDLENYVIHPAFDLFIWRDNLEKTILDNKNIHVCSNPLIHKRFGGEYLVYSGSKPVAKLKAPDHGIEFYVEQLNMECCDNDLDLFITLNKNYLIKHIMISRMFLNSLGEPDHVLVSFSGGKDSLVVLDLAVKHYGRDMVTGVYIDTGVDFPITSKYIELVSEKLGVRIEKIKVPVKDMIKSYGLPSKTNRWCTMMKTSGFKKIVEKYRGKYKKLLVLVGDRDSESEARARKPPVRKRRKYLEASPIKQWSTIHVQLYIWMYDLPENPLYKMGFYRLGCYICPALTSIEKHIMYNKLYNFLEKHPYFREFIDREVKTSF